MLRLGRPVGAFPRLEARLAAIHLGERKEPEREDTGCAQCNKGKGAAYKEPCSSSSSDSDSDSDCGCDEGNA